MAKQKSSPRRPHRVERTLAKQRSQDDAQSKSLLPSPNPVTNLLIVDIIVRGASTIFRQGIEKRVAQASLETEEEAQDLLDGRTLLTTLGLYGASKLATRSRAGLGVVIGGLAVKTLYDRGKARQKRRAIETERDN